jgi:hypothetical protein
MFKGWQIVAHEESKENIQKEEGAYRKNLEREQLTMWTGKVDQLMLYMA